MKAINSIFSGDGEGDRGGRGAVPSSGAGCTAEAGDVPVTVHTIGTVCFSEFGVNIKSQVDGPLLEAHFKEVNGESGRSVIQDRSSAV